MPAQKVAGRRFPLIIISIINKSRSQCFKMAGDGPCTIHQINLIQHAVNDAGRFKEGRGGRREKLQVFGGWRGGAVVTERCVLEKILVCMSTSQ